MKHDEEPILAGTGNLSPPSGTKSPAELGLAAGEFVGRNGQAPHEGLLIVNADDWGQRRETTDRILDCVLCGAVSSVSGMVFMKDSERAAVIAQEQGVDVGLHLNFTTPFSTHGSSRRLEEHQGRLVRQLRHRYSQVVFHPGLTKSFDYVIAAQIDEHRRLYGKEPERLDGHHHMHLCSNVLFGGLLPTETIVRRSFSFCPGERSFANRRYRKLVDWMLAKRHRLVDYFFSLPPLAPPERLRRIFSLARQFSVEIETHPANLAEYRFLREGEVFRVAGDIPVARRYSLVKSAERSQPAAGSNLQDSLSCSLPCAFALGTSLYRSLAEFFDYL